MNIRGVLIGGVLFVAMTLVACGNKNPPEPKQAPIGSIQVDGYVPQKLRDNLANAFDYLDSISAIPSTSSLSMLMAQPNLNGPILKQWLEDRVGFILPELYNYKGSVHIIQSPFAYENPNEVPEIEHDSETLAESTQAEIMMTNVGTAFYLEGKKGQFLTAFHMSGIGNVPLYSPRVGIIQIGEGLSSLAHRNPSHALDIYLLSILFHEARHSDGHGKTTGFIHALCPKGHKYEGLYACDRNLNGPYSIQREVLKELINTCIDCPTAALEFLRADNMDNSSRILQDGTTTNWDETPEGHR